MAPVLAAVTASEPMMPTGVPRLVRLAVVVPS